MSKNNVHYSIGTGNWMKVLGSPVDNYAKDGKEWTFDFTPDDEGALFHELGVGDRLKDKGDERGKFFQFRQRELRKDGTPNRPIVVVDARDHDWPQDKLLGNGTKIEVKFNYKDYGKGKFAGIYPVAIRVLDPIEYKRVEFAPLPEDNEYVQKVPEDTFKQDFGLQDDEDEE